MKQIEALEILKTGSNIFLTGAPGAGKTYVINEYIKNLKSLGIYPEVTASTGIAATHISGMTIHSWSGLGILKYINEHTLEKIMEKESVVKRVKAAKILIIDEISMLDASTLDNINLICKTIHFSDKAFGGMQIIFVGDFFQLPPVSKVDYSKQDDSQESYDEDGNEVQSNKAKFAFESAAWREAKPLICYLDEQHRQDDAQLLEILVAIREERVSAEHREVLEFAKDRTNKNINNIANKITKLFTHNRDVDDINERELNNLKENFYKYEMTSIGNAVRTESLKKSCLSPEILKLKIGAKVIFTKNDKEKKYVNGTLGQVSYLEANKIKVKLEKTGQIIEVEPDEWSIEENGKIKAKITQYPLRLAWAITVHKSQGMSLDEAFMDLSKVFEYGQGYVALSRVKTLSGLHLSDYNEKSLQIDRKVIDIDRKFRADSSSIRDRFLLADKSKLEKMQEDFILKCGGEKDFKPQNKEKIDTYTQTKILIDQGLSFDEIVKERQFTKGTILEHFDRLLTTEQIKLEEVLKLLPKKYNNLPKEIDDIFKKIGTSKMGEVHKHLKGEYDYDELKVYKMIYTFK